VTTVTMEAIAADGLRVSRGGHEVLHGLTFSVDRGSVTGLLGPNGSGKTTLMRSIVGVQVIDSGSLDVLGHPAGAAPLRRLIGYSTQDPAIYADLTVEENLRYYAAVLGAAVSDVDRVISDIALADCARRLGGALSGGQRSRLSLAVALLGTPELLVLDEPTVGFDPLVRRDLWALFYRLAADGVTVLVSSHVMDEAGRCERLVLLRDGLLLADGSPAELRGRVGSDDLEAVFLRLVKERERLS
jgi:ABC-2 type transport system ATP-binding protein